LPYFSSFNYVYSNHMFTKIKSIPYLPLNSFLTSRLFDKLIGDLDVTLPDALNHIEPDFSVQSRSITELNI
jgi:hypothetical protein